MEIVKPFLAKCRSALSAKRELPRRIVSFEVLRSLAFLFVVIQHAYAYLVPKFGEQPWMHGRMLGRAGVSIFIILSGASLALSSLSRGRGGYFRFLKKRLSSILPFYWVAYFAVGIFLFLFFGRFAMREEVPRILMTVFALDGYLATQFRTYYLIGEWFTGFILLMYLIAPFIYWSVRKTRGLVLPLYFIVSALSLHFSPMLCKSLVFLNTHAQYNVLSRVLEFSLGIAFTQYIICYRWRHALLSLVGCIYIVCRLASGYGLLNFSAGGFLALFCLFTVATLVLDMIPFSEGARQCIAFLSKYSFMAFLFHHQVLWVLKEKLTLQSTPMFTVYMILATWSLSYLLAWLFYRPAVAIKSLVFGVSKPSN